MENAFYEPVGQDTFAATKATVGPWSPDAQHGGPPSALVARALERHAPDDRQRLARVAVDILRPVPVGKVSIRVRMVRPGRRVALLEAVMEADGQEVLHARGWRIERPAGDVPDITDGGGRPEPIPADSDGLPPQIFRQERHGYLASIDWRFRPAQFTEATGPRATEVGAPVRAAWTRPLIPLLPDEEPSAMSRTLLVADSGSGVGTALPASAFIFVNVDLTVALSRDPVGEWLLLESSTMIGSDGTGLAMTRLRDPLGAFGRGMQTLLVAPR
ncbi:MAG TPA: thioesterase family protein [Streptosporangiaceae bacterium]|nr:thioesterase family protein [Streptosporangiaceae bacterium]